jgi:hypothetical protein
MADADVNGMDEPRPRIPGLQTVSWLFSGEIVNRVRRSPSPWTPLSSSASSRTATVRRVDAGHRSDTLVDGRRPSHQG